MINKVVNNVTIDEIQAIYFLLHSLNREPNRNRDIKLYVQSNQQIFSADFLKLGESYRSVVLKTFDSDFDTYSQNILMRNDPQYLWAIANKMWFKEHIYADYSYNQFNNLDILLPLVIEFVKSVSENTEYERFSQVAYNVSYISGPKFDFCVLPDVDYDVLSIEVSEN